MKDKTLKDIVVGAHLVAAESLHLGLASAMVEKQHPERAVSKAGNLESIPVSELAGYINSDIFLEASIGLAVINALLPVPENPDRGNAFNMIQAKSRDKNLGFIGHFHFADRLKAGTKNCWVFEKNPQGDDLDESKMDEFLPRCDIVVITGQTLMNGTLDRILELSPDAYKLMLGPSAPLSPVLFDYGIDAIGGVRVLEKDRVKKFISQGANFRQLPGIELLSIHK